MSDIVQMFEHLITLYIPKNVTCLNKIALLARSRRLCEIYAFASTHFVMSRDLASRKQRPDSHITFSGGFSSKRSIGGLTLLWTV